MEHTHQHTLWRTLVEVFTAEELTPLFALWLGVLGAVAGSFLCCAASRRGTGRSVWRGRSVCDCCGRTLAAWEMIPIFSCLVFRGRCRTCGGRIPPEAWLSELLGAAAFAGLTLRLGLTVELPAWLIFSSLLLLLGLIDAREQILPDGLLLAGAALRLAFWALAGFSLPALGRMALGAVSVSVPLLVLSLVMDRVLGRESMGGGDIKLLAVLGLWFPWQQMLLLLMAACVLGILGALITRARGRAFPFGPYIALAALITRLAGENVVAWYAGLF